MNVRYMIYNSAGSKPLQKDKEVHIYRGKYKGQNGTVISYNKKGFVCVRIARFDTAKTVHYCNLGYL